MRRPLALLAAVLALAASTARAAEPLDLDITRLGPPSAYVWASPAATTSPAAIPRHTPADEALASDARMRFAMLSSELALSLSSALLQPAATVGHSGFAFDMEVAYTQVHKEVVGTQTPFPPGARLVPARLLADAQQDALRAAGPVLPRPQVAPLQPRAGRPHPLPLPVELLRRAAPREVGHPGGLRHDPGRGAAGRPHHLPRAEGPQPLHHRPRRCWSRSASGSTPS